MLIEQVKQWVINCLLTETNLITIAAECEVTQLVNLTSTAIFGEISKSEQISFRI
jgi:hypothetical protein